MQKDETFREIVESFQSVKNRVIDFSLRMITLLLGPLYAYGLYDGWEDKDIMWGINLFILFFLLVFSLSGVSIQLNLKKYILLFILGYGNVFTTYHLGFVGGAQYFMIMTFGLLIFYFKRRTAILITVLLVAYYFLYMYLYMSGVIVHRSVFELISSSAALWIADFNMMVLIVFIMVYALHLTFKAYQQKGKEKIETQRQFKYTLHNLPIPVAVITHDEQITYTNDVFYRYFGFKSNEVPTLEHWMELVYPNDLIRSRVLSYTHRGMEKGFRERRHTPIEYFDFKTRYGGLRSAEVHYTFVDNVAVCAFIDITDRRRQRRLIVETAMQAEEQEKKRIARDLHDGVGPLLSTAKIYAHTLTQAGDHTARLSFGTKLSELLDNSIKELRNTINNVSPQILQKYGLTAALEAFADNIMAVVDVVISVQEKRLCKAKSIVELACYRSLTELINNAIKYGSPAHINIELKADKQQLYVTYWDDGKGFNFDEERNKGFGLSNMINRVESIGGEFIMKTRPGEGVKVDMVFDANEN
ncbi:MULTISPECIES: ATP-binding protein [unclassified Carboxylicivirga]|uniref:sensor histidine kinase n=1 Tax=Carboxylicivirga TaxID=1628153 RepID=UPI003D3412CF